MKIRLLVSKLAALLRIADGLDRSHVFTYPTIESPKNRAEDYVFGFFTHLKGNPELELWGANRKKQLFEIVFRKKIEFVEWR